VEAHSFDFRWRNLYGAELKWKSALNCGPNSILFRRMNYGKNNKSHVMWLRCVWRLISCSALTLVFNGLMLFSSQHTNPAQPL